MSAMNPTASIQSARLRLAHHYALKLQKASTTTRHGPAGRTNWLHLIDQDWEQIKNGQAWSAAGIAFDIDRASMCAAFTMTTANILQIKLTPAEQLTWARQGLEAAKKLNNGEAMRRLLYQVIELNLTLEVLDQMDEQAQQLMAWAEEARDDLTLGRTWNVMGAAAFIRGHYDHAHDCLSRSLSLLQARRAVEDIPIVLRGLARVAHVRGEIQQAHAYYLDFLNAATSVGNEQAVLLAHVSLSAILLVQGDYEEAAHHAERAVGIARSFGMTRIFPPAMLSLAHSEKWLGRYEEACQHYNEGIAAARLFGSRTAISNGLYGLGQTRYLQGNLDAALPPLEEALSIAREGQIPLRMCEISHDMVHVRLARGELEAARSILKEAVEISLRLAKPPWYAKSLAAAIMLWQAAGNLEQAAVWAGTLRGVAKNLHPTVFTLAALDVLEAALGSEHYQQAVQQGELDAPEVAVSEILNALQEEIGEL